MENQKNNIIDLTEKLKGREISNGYMIINVPIVLFYNQIGDTKQQIFDGKDIEHAPVLSVELRQGELKFLANNQETVDRLEQFMHECKLKTVKNAQVIDLTMDE